MTGPQVRREDEGHLVARAGAGDREAFAVLVRRHQDDVYTLATRLVSDRDLAADVTQEALIRAWRALPRFRGDAAFGTWLYRITVNTAWTQRRKARRHHWTPLEVVSERPTLDARDDPEAMGESAARRAAISSAVARLPVGTRAVVVLKDVYGWSHREIADALGISEAAAKVRLHRGRLRLQKELAGERR